VRRTTLFTAEEEFATAARACRRLRGAPVDDRAQPAPGGEHRQGYSGRGVPLSDLIEEGNLGLMHAIDKFEPARLPLLHLRDLVDPAGGGAGGDEPGPRDPAAGARGARPAAGAAGPPHAGERSGADASHRAESEACG
jgi:hypothetical protein